MPDRKPPPAKAPGTLPPEREIFVPIWSEPVAGGKAPPASARRVRADYVWTGVHLGASRVDPAIKPEKAGTTLLEFRQAATAPAVQPNLMITIRLPADRTAASPFLEVVDTDTLLQSRAWGRLLRRTAQGSEWAFVVPDPVPAPTGKPNPISAKVEANSQAERKVERSFELRLVTDASARK